MPCASPPPVLLRAPPPAHAAPRDRRRSPRLRPASPPRWPVRRVDHNPRSGDLEVGRSGRPSGPATGPFGNSAIAGNREPPVSGTPGHRQPPSERFTPGQARDSATGASQARALCPASPAVRPHTPRLVRFPPDLHLPPGTRDALFPEPRPDRARYRDSAVRVSRAAGSSARVVGSTAPSAAGSFARSPGSADSRQ